MNERANCSRILIMVLKNINRAIEDYRVKKLGFKFDGI
jgi:hypothetical protein